MIRPLVLYALILGPAIAWCQEELTLEQAVSLAVKNNRQVRAALLEVRKADEAIEVARTYRKPQFKLNVYELQLLAKSNFLFQPGVFGTFPQIGAVPPTNAPVPIARRPASIIYGQINQPLTQLRRINLGVQSQNLGRQIVQERARLQEQDIANQVKTAYYNLLQTQSAMEATDEAIKLYREVERVANRALAEQVVLKPDVLEAQAGLAKTELEAVKLHNTTSTLKERINELMGRELTVEFTVRAAIDGTPWETDLPAARSRALEQRPELREARLKMLVAENDVKMKRSEFTPDISFTFQYFSPFNLQVLPKNLTYTGFTMSWEVFDWGRKKHEMEAKSVTVEQAKASVDETAAQILVDVGNRYRKLDEARQSLRVAGLTREMAQERLRVGLSRYEQQAVLLKDVLQLQTSLAESRYKYQESLLSFWTARAELEKAIGER